MARIFVSYRHDDTAPTAGRLTDDLREHFGEASVFRDKESIEPGADWMSEIRRAIGRQGVVLVLIGRQWLAADEHGRRRLDNPKDPLRNEILGALDLGCTVVPVLVENVPLPDEDAIPKGMERLLQLNPVKLRDAEWKGYDFPRIVQLLESHGFRAVGTKPRAAATRWSPMAIAGLVVMGLAAIGVSTASDSEEHLGAGVVALVALVLAAFGIREVKKGKARGMPLGIVGVALSSLVLVAALGGSFERPDPTATQGTSLLSPDTQTTPLSQSPPLAAEPIPATEVEPSGPTVARAVNLSGAWMGSDGVANILQHGTEVVVQFPALGMALSGTVSGRDMTVQGVDALMQTWMLQLSLQEDGLSLAGTVFGPTGQAPYMLLREEALSDPGGAGGFEGTP